PIPERVRQTIQTLHYSRRTEKAYVYWVRRYLLFHKPREASAMGADEIRAFLSHIAVNEQVTASTQNQALCALVFLYDRVLGAELAPIGEVERAKVPKRLPVVLTRDEVRAVLGALDGVPRLVCRLLYGGGLRLIECLSLHARLLRAEQSIRRLHVRESVGAGHACVDLARRPMANSGVPLELRCVAKIACATERAAEQPDEADPRRRVGARPLIRVFDGLEGG